MAGLLSNEINNTEKISVFVGECKRMGISILPPDINKSGLKFTPETSEGSQPADSRGAPTLNAIRYGLAAIKNVGEAAMALAIRERDQRGEFNSLEDFCTRLDSRLDVKPEKLSVRPSRRRREEAHVGQVPGSLEWREQSGRIVGQPTDAQYCAFQTKLGEVR